MIRVWFLEDPARLARELTEIEALASLTDWLIGVNWSVDSGLCVDAVIRVHGNDYHVCMKYPTHFPSVPPIVRPTNADFRWTSHQYGGIDGPLCLQWGSDNWHADVTGAQMLESAYNLFQHEDPLGRQSSEIATPAPSRHRLTIGQELRSTWCRFYIGWNLLTSLKSLTVGTSGIMKFSLRIKSDTCIIVIHELTVDSSSESQIDHMIPLFMREGSGDFSLMRGLFFKTYLDSAMISGVGNISDLKSLLLHAHFNASLLAETISEVEINSRAAGVLVLDDFNTPHFFLLLSNNNLVKVAAICSPPTDETYRRPQNLIGLANPSIGIVGLGSAGSKIVVALARMGVKSFHLVDHDVFLPENIERHILDWGYLGEHKVDGVRNLLSRINPDIVVSVSKLHLTGQESASLINGELLRLSECDLLIDATANSDVFNLLTSVAITAQKPLIWLEVFGGGKGGLVARSRPERDPDPHTMRAAYNHFCEDNPAPEESVIASYTIENSEGTIMVGSDADVAIVANYAVQLAVDSLVALDQSQYPYSMYLIGLAKWWVFTAPFHNIPIATDHLRQDRNYKQPLLSTTDEAKIVHFLNGLFNKAFNATSSTS